MESECFTSPIQTNHFPVLRTLKVETRKAVAPSCVFP